MSRQTVLTPELIAAIEKALADGMPMKHAVGALGLSHNTFRKQLERGARDLEAGTESLFADLAAAVDRGRAARVGKWVGWLQLPNKDGEISEGALKFLLERLEPEQFGPRSHVQVEAKVEHSDTARDRIAAKLGAAERIESEGPEPEGAGGLPALPDGGGSGRT